MKREDLEAALASELPTDRMVAAQYFASTSSPELAQVLLDAAERETVPRIRRLLSDAHVLAIQPPREAPLQASTADGESEDATRLLADLGGLIRHESEPAIGWVRRAAKLEIEDFESSRTNAAIERLRSRIAGLALLAQAHRPPESRPVSLEELLRHCAPPDMPGGLFQFDLSTNDDMIVSDPNLMALILGNALQNAVDASGALENGQIFVKLGVSDIDFWISISNRFSGESFDFDEVSRTGTSSKQDHRGLGVAAMKVAAQRLGYSLSLQASGGVATFVLRGKRRP